MKKWIISGVIAFAILSVLTASICLNVKMFTFFLLGCLACIALTIVTFLIHDIFFDN